MAQNKYLALLLGERLDAADESFYKPILIVGCFRFDRGRFELHFKRKSQGRSLGFEWSFKKASVRHAKMCSNLVDRDRVEPGAEFCSRRPAGQGAVSGQKSILNEVERLLTFTDNAVYKAVEFQAIPLIELVKRLLVAHFEHLH